MRTSASTRRPAALDAAIGQRLAGRRRALGLSQRDLSRRLGLSVQQLCEYERGRNRIPTATLVRAAAMLDTRVALLVGEHPHADLTPALECLKRTQRAAELLTDYARRTPIARLAVLRLAQTV